MDFLKGGAPIYRGLCDACGTSRNIWMHELGEDIPCDCRHKTGCRGYYQIVYRGPKNWIPQHLHNVRCRCHSPAAAAVASAEAVLLKHVPKELCTTRMTNVVIEQAGLAGFVVAFKVKQGDDFGEVLLAMTDQCAADFCIRHFDGCVWNKGGVPITAELASPEEDAMVPAESDMLQQELENMQRQQCDMLLEALLEGVHERPRRKKVAQQGATQSSTLEDAADWPSSPVEQLAADWASAATEEGDNSTSSSAASGPGREEETVCCENLLLADAPMRCLSNGGRQHYFHASCMTSWIRQCQRDGADATCPNCRGPVQVRAGRLDEILNDEQSRLDAEEIEALRSFRDKIDSVDSLGWTDVNPHLWKTGVAAGIAVGLAALAVGAATTARPRPGDSDRE